LPPIAVAPDASPEDIDEVLESGGEEAIFQKHIMEDRKHAKAKQTLDYLKEKHNDLLALEKSITELNQVGRTTEHSPQLTSCLYDHSYSWIWLFLLKRKGTSLTKSNFLS